MPDTPQGRLFDQAEGYFVTKTLLALWRLGFLDVAAREDKVDLEQWAGDRGCNPDLLRAILGYLVVRGYFESDDGYVRLSELGRQTVPYFGYLPMLVGAYEPILGPLEDVLVGKLTYGVNLRRSEHELIGGLSAMEENLLTRLTEITEDIELRGVLDLGCGSARMLTKILHRNPRFRGVGVDWEQTACAEARRRLAAEGLAERCAILHGDASKVRDIPGPTLEGVDLVIAMFVMHEIYRQRSRAGVVACLGEVADTIGSGGRLLMIEVSRVDDSYAHPDLRFVPEYQLVHDFSRQRLASREEWQAMLEEAGLSVLRTEPAGMCEAFCFVAGRA